MPDKSKIAELQYSPKYERLEVSLPPGSKFEDFPALSKKLFSEDLLKRLKMGCPGCHSGIPIFIKERYENIVHVDLNTMEVVERTAEFR